MVSANISFCADPFKQQNMNEKKTKMRKIKIGDYMDYHQTAWHSWKLVYNSKFRFYDYRSQQTGIHLNYLGPPNSGGVLRFMEMSEWWLVPQEKLHWNVWKKIMLDVVLRSLLPFLPELPPHPMACPLVGCSRCWFTGLTRPATSCSFCSGKVTF